MNSKYLEEIIVFIINLSACWLAVWVYFANKKGKLNKWFAVMTFFVAMWVDFAFLANRSQDVFYATTLYRLNFTFVALFLVAFYFFYIIHFFNASKRYVIIGKIVSVAGITLAALSLFTGLVVKEAVIRGWGTDIVFGNGNILFDLYSMFVAVLVIGFSVKKYIHLPKNQKLKVQYFSVGIFIFLFCNVIFNIILPNIIRTVEFSRYGDYSAIILLAFTAYAITKNNLMGVKALIAQVIIIIMSIVLAVDILFFSDNIGMRLVKIGVLATFLYFSRELINSVKREKEITGKIEKANLILAERNKDLHILLDVSSKVGQNLDSRKISQDIVDSVPKSLEYLGYTMGVIVLYNKEKDYVYVYAVTDSPLTQKIESVVRVSILKFREKLSKSDDLIIKTIKDKKAYASNRIGDFFGGFMSEEKGGQVQNVIKANSFISIPLFSSGQVIGVIVFSNEKPLDHITERSKEIVRAFASHIGSAIENAQLYEKTNNQMKELSKLNDDLEKTNVRLNESLEVKNEFLHITSHQLRTPLTAIRGMISMWMDGDFDKMPDEQRKEMLRRIYVSTERLNNITNDMLDALEWEGGVLKLEFKKVSVMEIVKDTMTTLKPDYDKKGLYLEFDEVDENIPDVEGEPNYLSQIFMNLVDNACKYTRTGGTKISMKKSGKYVDIYVKDTGIGMEEKDIKRAFEKFTRGENAMKENASGSGLGLFIVKKILDQHNGKITITCDGPDKGTAFKVSLLIKQE